MHVINVRNVNEALPEGLRLLLSEGVTRDSRNGPVLEMPHPVTTVYERPEERVLFHPLRDANPFFHLFESLWMLAGRRDVAYVARFVTRMKTFSDDGHTLHGAYGHRWRNHFRQDQLDLIIKTLQANPADRRCVLAMWDPTNDLAVASKDIPCNTHAYFGVGVDGRLNMTVCCRSNDIIWGAYGANAVHFSILQEYVARCLNRHTGTMTQVSNNYHAYVATLDPLREIADSARDPHRSVAVSPYHTGLAEPYPLLGTDRAQWGQDLDMFLQHEDAIGFRDRFFRRVAIPVLNAWKEWKHGDRDSEERFIIVGEILQQCHATDWRLACEQWIDRRHDNWKEKQ